MSESLSIRVVARFRPVNAREQREMQGGKDAFAYAISSASGSSSGQQAVSLSGRLLSSGDFAANLDRILDVGTTQDEMFVEVSNGQASSGRFVTPAVHTHSFYGPSALSYRLRWPLPPFATC